MDEARTSALRYFQCFGTDCWVVGTRKDIPSLSLSITPSFFYSQLITCLFHKNPYLLRTDSTVSRQLPLLSGYGNFFLAFSVYYLFLPSVL